MSRKDTFPGKVHRSKWNLPFQNLTLPVPNHSTKGGLADLKVLNDMLTKWKEIKQKRNNGAFYVHFLFQGLSQQIRKEILLIFIAFWAKKDIPQQYKHIPTSSL